MGRRQFEFSRPDWDQHSSHNGTQVSGPLGKVFYSIKHAGSSYRCLDLNEDGKRSRRAPPERGRVNKRAIDLARGVPSNFNKKVVFCDQVSRRAGQEAFEAWLCAKRTPPVPTSTTLSQPSAAA